MNNYQSPLTNKRLTPYTIFKRTELHLENMKHLIKLQKVDIQLDELNHMRGDLPDQIEDLAAELEGIRYRIQEEEKFLLNADIEIRRVETDIVDTKEKIEKYKAQHFEVRNNREFDALTKEIDALTKSIDGLQKKIEDIHKKQETARTTIETNTPKISQLEEELKEKNEQLKEITKDSIEEEKLLTSERKKLSEKTDTRLLGMYERMRSARDGKVIVQINRGACGGCYKVIPLQRQTEIRKGSKPYTCEHCGRIIVSETVYTEAFNN